MKLIGVVGNASAGKDTVAGILERDRGWVVAALADRIKQLAYKIFDFGRETLFGPSALRNELDSRGADASYWRAVYLRAGMASGELIALFEGGPPGVGERVMPAFLELLEGLQRHPAKFSARHVLQQIGTEFGRALWDGVWVANLRRIVRKVAAGWTYDRMTGLAFGAVDPPPGVVVSDLRFANEVAELKAWGGFTYWIDATRRGITRTMDHGSEPDAAAFAGLVHGVIDNGDTLDALRLRVWALADA